MPGQCTGIFNGNTNRKTEGKRKVYRLTMYYFTTVLKAFPIAFLLFFLKI